MRFLSYAIIMLVLGVLFGFAKKEGDKANASIEDGEFTMRMPTLYKIVFVITAIFFAVISYFAIKDIDNSGIYIAVGCVVLFLGSLFGIYASIVCRVDVRRNSITYKGAVGKEVEIPFSFIQEIKCTAQGIKVKTEVKKFSLDRYTIGLEAFIDLMRDKGIKVIG